MPPRHAYWTILVDDQPTAFRAHDPEELLPTLNRLREKNASAIMKWFERGQLFDSREAAREAGYGRGERRWEGPRPERLTRDDEDRGDRHALNERGPRDRREPRERRDTREPREGREARGPHPPRDRRETRRPRDTRDTHHTRDTRDTRDTHHTRDTRNTRDARDAREGREGRERRDRHDVERPRDKNWRPGGEHRDPRQKYSDAKKAKWNRFKQKIRERHEQRGAERDAFRPQRKRDFAPSPEYSPPHGDPLRRREREDRRDRERPPFDRPVSDRPPSNRPRFDRPYEGRPGKPSRPHGDKLRTHGPKQDRRSQSGGPARGKWDRPSGAAPKRKPWNAKPAPRKPRFEAPRGKPFPSAQGKWRGDRNDRPRRRRDDEE
jgi:hypothetical protein